MTEPTTRPIMKAVWRYPFHFGIGPHNGHGVHESLYVPIGARILPLVTVSSDLRTEHEGGCCCGDCDYGRVFVWFEVDTDREPNMHLGHSCRPEDTTGFVRREFTVIGGGCVKTTRFDESWSKGRLPVYRASTITNYDGAVFHDDGQEVKVYEHAWHLYEYVKTD